MLMVAQTYIPPTDANTINGIPYPTTIGSASQVITPVDGVLVWADNPSFVGVTGVDATNISQVQFYRVGDTVVESFAHTHVE